MVAVAMLRGQDVAVDPLWWTRLGPLGRLLEAPLRPHRTPLLVISIPRSGSSWVGGVLGSAPGALYLREPFNQLHLAAGGEQTLFRVAPGVGPDAAPAAYERAGECVFSARPTFPRALNIVQERDQWTLARRRKGLLVIKEVNPLALEWLLHGRDLRVLLLVRHPAAVTLSLRRMGWWGSPEDHPDQGPDAETVWCKHGERQAEVLSHALEVLDSRPDTRLVTYEELCAEPQAHFEELARWAGLDWGAEQSARVAERSGGGNRGDAYSTNRDSRAMAEAWRDDVGDDQLHGLRAGWRSRDLPWYSEDAEW